MSSSRDFLAATVADAALPLLRRPVEDLIYETLDARQVPSRTDFKELRDLVNNLRGQLVGATGGVRRLVEQAEGVVERVSVLEDSLDAAQQHLREMAQSALPGDEVGAAAAVEERVLGLEARFDGMAEQLEALSTADRGPGEAAMAELVAVRAELDGLAPRGELRAVHAELRTVRDQQAGMVNDISSATAQIEALAAALGRLDLRLSEAPRPLSEAALLARVDSALQASIPAVLDRMILRQVQAALSAQAPVVAAPSPAAAPASDLGGASAAAAPSLCKVPGCEAPARARGFCQRHYQHWKRNRLDGFPNPDGA